MSDTLLRFSVASDLHIGTRRYFSPETFAAVNEHSDFLLLPGDLTQHGYPEEIAELTTALDAITCPIYLVAGNHDIYSSARRFLEAWDHKPNIHCLNGEHAHLHVRDLTIGIAGTKGTAGGYAPYLIRGFGETALSNMREMAELEASRLDLALQQLQHDKLDFTIAITHYAPFKDNLGNEPIEIQCVLGNSRLGDAIQKHSVNFCAHGHAHLGESGLFPMPEGHGHYLNASLAANHNKVCHVSWDGTALSLTHI